MVITKQKPRERRQKLREKETVKQQNNQRAISKMTSVSPYILILTLNQNGWSSHTEWLKDKNTRQNICCVQEMPFRFKDIYRFKVKGKKKVFHASRNQKQKWKIGRDILISEKQTLSEKVMTRDREGHYIMIVGSVFSTFCSCNLIWDWDSFFGHFIAVLFLFIAVLDGSKRKEAGT